MTVLFEPFASVYDDGSRIGVILARTGRGFEAYAADDHSLGLFPSPRKAAAAITTMRAWVAQTTAENKPSGTNNDFPRLCLKLAAGVDHGKANDKTQRTGSRDFVLRRHRH
jgi:hypothetical protein